MGITVLHGIDQSVPTAAKLPRTGNDAARVYVQDVRCFYAWDDVSDTYQIDGTVCFEFDVAEDGGDMGDIVIGALPAGTIVLDGMLDVITAPVADTDESSSSSSSNSTSSSASTSSSDSRSSDSDSSGTSSSSGDDGISISSVAGADILTPTAISLLTAGRYDVKPVGTAATTIKALTATDVTLTLGTNLSAGRIAVYLRCVRGLA
jgi:hypothetical protein